MYTPESIKALDKNQIFVFGSNLAGNHAGGAARYAAEHFGAKEGMGEGLTGQCYAFPTLNKDFSKRTLPQIRDHILDLYECAEANKQKTFLVTKVGCGIAGFSEKEIGDLFREYDKPDNVVLPKEFS